MSGVEGIRSPRASPPEPEAALRPGSTDDASQLRRNGADAPAGETGLDSDRIDDIVRRVLEELKR